MVVDGIRYLYVLRIIYRDLKFENFLYYYLGVESKILITDFGLVYFGNKSGDWIMRILCGILEYIVFEVLLRKFYISVVDMWVFGVITFVLFSGFLFFDDESYIRFYRKILIGKYDYVREVRDYFMVVELG